MQLERLGKYELLERLGQGGMGEVWKARDTQLQRFVAIKLLHAELQTQPDFVERFTREARFVASLHHPNIVQIHDFEIASTNGSRVRAYMVMDYIEGGTLADYIRASIRKGFYPPAAALVDLFASIGLALDYAHQQGMIHRDIKPANILLDKADSSKPLGEPILTDFGIARLQNAGDSTVSYALVGTPLYISPEQAEGRTLDERSDLYSLGIVLYEMLTGVTPFRGDSAIAIMMKHVHEQPEPPARINPSISPTLSAVVLRSIAKEPRDRFPSATAMTVALAQALNAPLQPSRLPLGITPLTPTLAVPSLSTAATMVAPPSQQLPQSLPSPPAPFTRPPHSLRRWLLVAAIACVLLALIGASAFTVFPQLFSARSVATSTPNATGNVVGHITFVASSTLPATSQGLFDQVQIDLNGVSPPPASTTYYAWLGTPNNEVTVFPHWPLQVTNGAVHGTFASNPPHTDLFASSAWFLITAESTTSPPVIPFPETDRHIYYALISHTSTSSPTFEVRACPPGNAANAISPCR